MPPRRPASTSTQPSPRRRRRCRARRGATRCPTASTRTSARCCGSAARAWRSTMSCSCMGGAECVALSLPLLLPSRSLATRPYCDDLADGSLSATGLVVRPGDGPSAARERQDEPHAHAALRHRREGQGRRRHRDPRRHARRRCVPSYSLLLSRRLGRARTDPLFLTLLPRPLPPSHHHPAAAYLPLITHLRQLITSRDKKSYTVAVGKLNPAKLANFIEVECWVLVACPENSMVDSKVRTRSSSRRI